MTLDAVGECPRLTSDARVVAEHADLGDLDLAVLVDDVEGAAVAFLQGLVGRDGNGAGAVGHPGLYGQFDPFGVESRRGRFLDNGFEVIAGHVAPCEWFLSLLKHHHWSAPYTRCASSTIIPYL